MMTQGGGTPRSSVGDFKCVKIDFRHKSERSRRSKPLTPVCLSGDRG